tara:strand:- start:142 stop:615 length:474 start_codon:yes stop_codon:yes gene_type:complete
MKKIILTGILFLMMNMLSAQDIVSVSGGEASGIGGSFSYTVGQVFYSTIISSTGSVSQGLQQSIELFTLSNSELTSLTLKAVTYPNPTSDYLVLAISDGNITNLTYVLYDINGRALAQGKCIQSNTQIDMQSLAIGTYVLKVNKNSQEIKTFKIIKN